jgi:hypothetical protein
MTHAAPIPLLTHAHRPVFPIPQLQQNVSLPPAALTLRPTTAHTPRSVSTTARPPSAQDGAPTTRPDSHSRTLPQSFRTARRAELNQEKGANYLKEHGLGSVPLQ